ncbi:MAG TPA: ornithine cyclodeaminase family protein, partial [Longimicrobiales bacterium]|nr:ornithine cyclodeaminase family protein [Longimicrobiales bacterium]
MPESHGSASELLILGGDDVRRLMPMMDCIEIVDTAMRAVSRGNAELPLRFGLFVPGTRNILAVMPGFLGQPRSLGAKVIAVFPENAGRGLSSHLGIVVLFDPDSGVPVAILDAAAITGLRTAAASAVATRALAREDAGHLAILGTGEQAAAHVQAIAAVRTLRAVTVWGRSPEKARAFADRESRAAGMPIAVADEVEMAVAGADIVCTTTSSTESILRGAWIRRGTHVNLVGASAATSREADESLVAKSGFYVDLRASALAQAGELLEAMGSFAAQHIRGEIGQVLNGDVAGRTNDAEVT